LGAVAKRAAKGMPVEETQKQAAAAEVSVVETATEEETE
jgi:hypothetical protein